MRLSETNLEKAVVELSKHPRMTSDNFYELNVNFDPHAPSAINADASSLFKLFIADINPVSHMGAHKTRDALANPDFLSSLGRPQPRCPHTESENH